MNGRVRSIAVAVVVLLAFLVLAEIATRRWLKTTATMVDDPRFGRIPQPHQRYINWTEGYSRRRTNAFGFFDDDTLPVRPRRRVLLFGDSFTEALQMRQDQTYASVAERLLPGVEIVNVAQSGRYPFYYAATLPAFQQIFHPDVVVVQINEGDLAELDDPIRETQTRDELAASARIAVSGVPRRGPLRRLLHGVALLKLFSERVDRLRAQERVRWIRKWKGTEMNQDEITGRVPARAPAELDSLIEVMRRVNPRIVLVTMPHIVYLEDPPHVFYPVRCAFFREFAARHGLPIVDPADSLIAEYRRTGQPLQGFGNSEAGIGHYNARGAAVIGRLLADVLRKLP